MTTEINLFISIARCGKLGLCNPQGELDSEVDLAISEAIKANNGEQFENQQIFIAGHSLGGTGARHWYDAHLQNQDPFGGLIIFGTQYNGDHEDFKGALGFPLDLREFPTPFLSQTNNKSSFQ